LSKRCDRAVDLTAPSGLLLDEGVLVGPSTPLPLLEPLDPTRNVVHARGKGWYVVRALFEAAPLGGLAVSAHGPLALPVSRRRSTSSRNSDATNRGRVSM
jgi:hypothetical protein